MKTKEPKKWMVGAHLNGLEVVDAQFDSYRKIYPHIRGQRNMGSLAIDLCYLADNVLDVVFNRGCYMWDLAAAQAILNEAGGELYDVDGNPLLLDWENSKTMYHIIACHPDIKDQVMSFI